MKTVFKIIMRGIQYTGDSKEEFLTWWYLQRYLRTDKYKNK